MAAFPSPVVAAVPVEVELVLAPVAKCDAVTIGLYGGLEIS